MAVDVRFLGQACFELKAGGVTVLTDPFLTGNPLAAASADEVEADVILLTHGHADHLGDTVDIAKRAGEAQGDPRGSSGGGPPTIGAPPQGLAGARGRPPNERPRASLPPPRRSR